MKTSKEMADAVLRKRDAIEKEREKRNIIIRRSVIVSAAACAAGFIVFSAGKFSPEKPDLNNAVLENTVTDTVKPEETTTNGTETAPSAGHENDGQKDAAVSEQTVTDNTDNTEKADKNEVTSPAPEKTPQTEENIKTPLPSPAASPKTKTDTAPSAVNTPSPSVLPSPDAIAETPEKDESLPETDKNQHEKTEDIPEVIPADKTEEHQLESAPNTETEEETKDDTPVPVKEKVETPSSSMEKSGPAESPQPESEGVPISEKVIIPVTAFTKIITSSGTEYYTDGETILSENTRDPAGIVKAFGIYNGEECVCEADAYQITDRPESEALAVKFYGNEDYYLFVTDEQQS